MAPRTPSGPAPDSAVARAAVRALVEAASVPMAVFDADGTCVVANGAFVVASARPHTDAHPAEQRADFSPDGACVWTVATLPSDGGTPPALQFIDAAANALPVLFSAKDTQGRYLFVNRFQAAMFGVSPANAIGKTATELVGGSFARHTRDIDAEVIKTGRAVPFYEERFPATDGTMRHLLTGKVPLFGAPGEVWGVATVGVDITERMRLEEKLREAKEQAELGSRAKSRFLGTMSHELRTPLNAVIGFAELMQEEALGPLGHADYKEYAGLILRSGNNLLDMISNLLDFARADSGSLELAVAPVELVRMLRGVLTRTREQIATASVPGRITLREELPADVLAIRADEQRLRQVLRGVIDNAIKFTPDGGRVTVSARALPDSGAEIVVSDTGIGMTAEELRHVFEPFWQADSSLGRARNGAGIGLKLARQLMELHGGTLAMESARGAGTKVTLRLPPMPPPRL